MANKRITDVDTIELLNSDESFFVNQNNTIKQINKNNIVFGLINGGTGAATVEAARENLDVYSKSEAEALVKSETESKVDSLINNITVLVPVSEWNENDSNDILVSGLLSSDLVVVDIFTDGLTIEEQKVLQEEWGNILQVIILDNAIKLSASKAPTVDLPLKLMIIRK